MGSGWKSGERGSLPQQQAKRSLPLRPKQTAIWLATGLVASVAVIAAGLVALSDGAGGAADQAAVEPAPAGAAPLEPEVAAGGRSGTATSQAAAQPGPGAGGPSEGIKVRGAWTIQVFNPDGSMAQKVEFENALRLEGADALAAALAGNTLFPDVDLGGGPETTFPFWTIFLADLGTLLPSPEPGLSPCDVARVFDLFLDPSMIVGNNALGTGCWLLPVELETIIPTEIPGVGVNLSGVVVPDAAAGDVFTLTGSVAATQDGRIDFVESFVWLWIEVPAPLPGSPGLVVADVVDFTGTALNTPVDVVNGQEIQVTFELSFQ